MEAQTQGDAKLRGLKILVSFLGVLIVLGTALVIGVVIKRIYARPAAPSITQTIPGTFPAAGLSAGDHISGIASAGGVFAVWVTAASGDKVLLIDPQTGAVSTVLK